MAQKKKLQVFISSTYADLQEERQAAVQAILTAGHIPAGMELFAAGDETQMNVIKRWIDESDAYLLILGGRYGSIETKSQKSYIHLEYEYAVEQDKPLFAIVINKNHLEEKVKKHGTEVIELEHPDKLKEFRELVCSKMVRFWSDPKDIKLSILETIAEFSNRADLVGWIPGNETVNTGAVAEEIAKLVKENNELRASLSKSSGSQTTYNGLTFEEMYNLLYSNKIELKDFVKDRVSEPIIQRIQELASFLGETQLTLLHYYWFLKERFREGSTTTINSTGTLIKKLSEFGLIMNQGGTWALSESGKQFLLRLRLESKFQGADKYSA